MGELLEGIGCCAVLGAAFSMVGRCWVAGWRSQKEEWVSIKWEFMAIVLGVGLALLGVAWR